MLSEPKSRSITAGTPVSLLGGEDLNTPPTGPVIYLADLYLWHTGLNAAGNGASAEAVRISTPGVAFADSAFEVTTEDTVRVPKKIERIELPCNLEAKVGSGGATLKFVVNIYPVAKR